MTLKLSQLRAKLESGIEFYDGAFFLEFLEHINFTVSRSQVHRSFEAHLDLSQPCLILLAPPIPPAPR